MLKKIKVFFENLSKDRIKLWKTITLISIVLFLLISVFSAWRLFFSFKNNQAAEAVSNNSEKKAEEIKNAGAEICPDCQRRIIDGVFVPRKEINRPLNAVMIDNHPSARPLFGIERANLVYEAEVEGNYTRLMAIFSTTEKIEKIGPVRSARPYFIDWAQELNAIYGHCGGSPEALVKISQNKIIDFNEYYNGQYFWRDSARSAPHNIFISNENLNKFSENKGIANGDFSPWLFKDDLKKEARSAKNKLIAINYNHPEFKIKWLYDENENNYFRLANDEPQLTGAGNKISAKNIIIQFIPAEVIDDKLRLEMEATGSGEAIICLDGECRKATWEKENSKSRTKFYYSENREVEFNAGQTWIEIARPEVEVIY